MCDFMGYRGGVAEEGGGSIAALDFGQGNRAGAAGFRDPQGLDGWIGDFGAGLGLVCLCTGFYQEANHFAKQT